MRRTKRTLGSVVLVTGVLTAGVATLAAAEAEKLDGDEVFAAQRCAMCHAVAAAGVEARTTSEKLRGPDLSGLETETPSEDLAAFVRGETLADGRKHKKSFKGSDEELRAILDWLGSLEPQE